MMMDIKFIFLALLVFVPAALADRFGRPDISALQDSATICLEVGTQAELTGLDGAAGTEYVGGDQFHLSANAAVRVLIENTVMQLNDHSISTVTKVDGFTRFFDTEVGTAHDMAHNLQVVAELGSISTQLAGSYQSTVTLTVVPQLGGSATCGASTLFLAGDSNVDYAVLAFEDLYPSAGDADYNDFVVRYSVEEAYNANGELENVTMNYTPIARGAGYNHALLLDLDGEIERTRNAFTETVAPFIGEATVKVTYTNQTNENQVVKYYDVDDDIPIFHNTRASLDGFANVYADTDFTAPKLETRVEIMLSNPELNLLTSEHEVAVDKYRVFLDVHNTNNDIDLAVINPDDGMIDANGYPFGIIVPHDWAWMLERNHIEDAYPYFSEYRAFLNGESEELSPEAKNWFKAIDTETDFVIDLDALDTFLEESAP